MAELQMLNLPGIVASADQVNAGRQQNRLLQLMEPYKMREADRSEQTGIADQNEQKMKRAGMLARVGLGMFGDPAQLPDDAARNQAWQDMIGNLRMIAPDIDSSVLPGQYSEQGLKWFQSLATTNDGAGANVQSTYIDRMGRRIAIMRDGSQQVLGEAENRQQLTPEGLAFDPRSGVVAAPAGADLIAQRREEEAQRQVITAGGKRAAELGAEVGMAQQVAGARGAVAGAEEAAKAGARNAADFAASFQKKANGASSVMSSLDAADELLDAATGSYAGAFLDEAGRFFGKSTEGAQAVAGLKIIQADLMLGMPRMEGPQSDRDVQLYKEAAAQVGEPTIPADTKRAAVRIIRRLQSKYAQPGQSGQAPAGIDQETEQILRRLGI